MLQRRIPNKYQKHIFNHNFFEVIDTEEKAYWLGFIAADGNIYKTPKNQSLIRISQRFEDREIIFKFCQSINFNLEPRMIKDGTYKIQLTSTKMYNDLLDKGITPRKSLTLKPPKNVPKDLVRHWIRGYFDGDGSIHIHKKNDMISIIILGTYEILEFILKNSKISSKIERQKRHNVHKIRKGGQKSLEFLDFIYKDSKIYLERKYNYYFQNLYRKVG